MIRFALNYIKYKILYKILDLIGYSPITPCYIIHKMAKLYSCRLEVVLDNKLYKNECLIIFHMKHACKRLYTTYSLSNMIHITSVFIAWESNKLAAKSLNYILYYISR